MTQVLQQQQHSQPGSRGTTSCSNRMLLGWTTKRRSDCCSENWEHLNTKDTVAKLKSLFGAKELSSASSSSWESCQNNVEFRCDVTIAGNTHSEVIRVTEKQLQLLGSDLVDCFDLWSVPMDTFCCQVSSSSTSSAALSSAFPEVVSEKLGLCSKVQEKLDVKEQCKPVFCPKRPVAYSMYNTVDQELDRLQQLKIITPVDYSEWAAPIVVVRKANGGIRVCGDYSTGLNFALQPHQYLLPLPKDIFAKLANCKFSVRSIFRMHFCKLRSTSSHLLTINTHRGLFHYNRLPPGVKAAPVAHRHHASRMCENVPSEMMCMR
ncbi:uncharacterized protein K02A2.6-like [Malaya genurostris]|uniref:uncharacterized protein K02A2.6-like n=1 Tax=Malaya genurostris TaxID=325434 RepID=UPI0026F3D77A|nr:uncharacterized protein K02A2.6-like [Malaya genurostris]